MKDTKKIVVCPACGEKMLKVYMPEHGFDLDICVDSCGGIFFDNRELNKYDDENENADIIFEYLGSKFFQKTDESKIRICPACNTPMVKMGAGVSDVEIDVCNVCGAKFLDNGELEKIRNPFSKDEFIATIEHLLR